MEKGIIYTAPNDIRIRNTKTAFLAGTIDNGDSEDWQILLAEKLSKQGIDVFNPRRSDWNPEATTIELREQIAWELHAIDQADIIIFNILPDSKSPISLMELGLCSDRGHRVTVFCPKEFYRFENVRMVCEKYRMQLIEKTVQDAILQDN